MDQRYVALVAAMQLYFDGLYHSDTKILAKVFHPKATYSCATDGTLTHLTMDQYFPVVDKRPAPAASQQPRSDRIVSIAFAGPTTALVTANCAIGPKRFTDLLSFVYLEGRWQIIAKVFHFDLAADAP